MGLYLANLEAIGLLWWYLDSWLARSQFCALRGIARCVCWRDVLLEDESGGQPAIALKER